MPEPGDVLDCLAGSKPVFVITLHGYYVAKDAFGFIATDDEALDYPVLDPCFLDGLVVWVLEVILLHETLLRDVEIIQTHGGDIVPSACVLSTLLSKSTTAHAIFTLTAVGRVGDPVFLNIGRTRQRW